MRRTDKASEWGAGGHPLGQAGAVRAEPVPPARSVARVALFDRLLGITTKNADVLDAALRRAAIDADATPGAVSAFGAKYEVRFPMTGPRGTFVVLSVWIVPTGTDVPVLVTVYIE